MHDVNFASHVRISNLCVQLLFSFDNLSIVVHRLYSQLHMLSVGQTAGSSWFWHLMSKVHWITCHDMYSNHQVWQSLLSQCNTTCLVLKWNQSWIHPSIKHFRDTLHSWVMEFQIQAGLPHNFTPEAWFLGIWDEKLNLKQLLLQCEHVNFCQQSRTKS